MDILKVKDPKTGKWIAVPAIKGRDGKDAVTDLEYDPTSKNAQSGVAVAEAIEAAVGDINTVLSTLVTVEE